MQRNNLSYYDQWADQWWNQSATVAPLNRLNPLRFQFFDQHILSWKGLKVLDVGCGGGFTCEFLAERGAQVTGVDQSAACILAASAHAADMDYSIEYQRSEAEQLPFADDSFDVVTCVDVLEHVDNARETVAQISRVLKPGGRFCFDTINRTWQSRLVMIWLLENTLRQIPCGVHDWRKFITPAELTDMLKRQGMEEVAIAGFDLFGKGIIGKWKRLRQYQTCGEFQTSFDTADDSPAKKRRRQQVMYIGVAVKNIQS